MNRLRLRRWARPILQFPLAGCRGELCFLASRMNIVNREKLLLPRGSEYAARSSRVGGIMRSTALFLYAITSNMSEAVTRMIQAVANAAQFSNPATDLNPFLTAREHEDVAYY